MADLVGLPTNKDTHLQLKVQPLALAKHRLIGSLWLRLSPRPDNIPVNHHGRRPAMIPNRNMHPVLRQSIFGPPDNGSHIKRMIPRSVEIGIVAYPSRQVHLDILHLMNKFQQVLLIILQDGISPEEPLEGVPRLHPVLPVEPHEYIELVVVEHLVVLLVETGEQLAVEQAELLHLAQVDDPVA